VKQEKKVENVINEIT